METTIILAESPKQLTVEEMRQLHRFNGNYVKEEGLTVLYKEHVKDGNVARRRIFAYTNLLHHEKVMEQYSLPQKFINLFGTRKYTKDEVEFFNHICPNDSYICVMEVKLNGKYYYCWRLKSKNNENAIIKRTKIKDILLPQDDTTELREGMTHQVSITQYERNQDARKRCLQHYGYTCQVCGMNFEQVYGEIGKNFIEVHHLNPIAKAGGEYTLNPIQDMIPLCSNCHSMIHRGGKEGKPMTLECLRDLYNAHIEKRE